MPDFEIWESPGGLVWEGVDQEEAFLTALRRRRRGIGLLIVEQNARTALRNADRAYVLEQGQVRFEGSGEEILHDPEVQRAYLGS